MTAKNSAHRIAVARGDIPADLILRGGKVVNVLSGDIYETDIVIVDGVVAALGTGYEARQVVDMTGPLCLPRFH